MTDSARGRPKAHDTTSGHPSVAGINAFHRGWHNRLLPNLARWRVRILRDKWDCFGLVEDAHGMGRRGCALSFAVLFRQSDIAKGSRSEACRDFHLRELGAYGSASAHHSR